MKLTKWQKRKAKLLKKQDNLCFYCKSPLVLRGVGLVATIDHVIPLSKGGSNRLTNLVASCFRCNHDKGNNLPEFGDLTDELQLEAVYGERG